MLNTTLNILSLSISAICLYLFFRALKLLRRNKEENKKLIIKYVSLLCKDEVNKHILKNIKYKQKQYGYVVFPFTTIISPSFSTEERFKTQEEYFEYERLKNYIDDKPLNVYVSLSVDNKLIVSYILKEDDEHGVNLDKVRKAYHVNIENDEIKSIHGLNKNNTTVYSAEKITNKIEDNETYLVLKDIDYVKYLYENFLKPNLEDEDIDIIESLESYRNLFIQGTIDKNHVEDFKNFISKYKDILNGSNFN